MTNKTKTLSYLRVSTPKQDTEKDKAAILLFANEKKLQGPVEFIEEVVTGKKPWKLRKIATIVESLKKGDTLLLPEISRMGRTMFEIMEMLSILKRNAVNVYGVRDDYDINNEIYGAITSFMYSYFAELECKVISTRTKEALAFRKSQGVKLGRPKGTYTSRLDPHKQAIIALLKLHVPRKVIALKYNITENGFNYWFKKNGLKALDTDPKFLSKTVDSGYEKEKK